MAEIQIEEKLGALISNLISIVFCLGLGLFSTYVKILPPESLPYFSSFLFYFCIPLLLFSEVAMAEVDSYLEVLKVLGIMLAANIFMYFFTAVLTTTFYRSFKSGAILGLCTTFSSSIFLSLPIVKTLDELNGKSNYALYCSLAFFLWDITLVPLSVLILEIRQSKRKRRSSYCIRSTIGLIRTILNPVTFPIGLGLVFLSLRQLTGYKIPSPIIEAFSFVGKLSTSMSIFIMGMGIHGKELLGNSLFDSLVLIGLKQIVMPLLVIVLLSLCGVTDKDLLTSLYLTNATPPAQVIFLLSVQYGNVAILQVSSCLVLGIFLSIPLLFMSVSFLQLDWTDFMKFVDISDPKFEFIILKTVHIMNICTLICGVLTIFPFFLNPSYRVRLRRFVTMLVLCQMGTSFFFMLGTIEPFPMDNVLFCKLQGVGIQFFAALSMLWFLFTSMQMSFKFVFSCGGGIIREFLLHLFAFFLAIVTAIVPVFLPSGWSYAKGGGAPWCWLENVWLQFALFYIPYITFFILGILNVILIQISERSKKKKFKKLDLPDSFKKAKANLLWKCRIFIIIFCIFWSFGFVNRFLQLVRQNPQTFFLLVWLHIIFSCGQGVPTFIIFGTGTQIMQDYKIFFGRIAQKFKFFSNITKILSGRGGTYGISSNKNQIDDHKDDEDDGIEFATGFLFSPTTLRKLSTMAKVKDVEEVTNIEMPLQSSFSISLLGNDYETSRRLSNVRIRAVDSSDEDDEVSVI